MKAPIIFEFSNMYKGGVWGGFSFGKTFSTDRVVEDGSIFFLSDFLFYCRFSPSIFVCHLVHSTSVTVWVGVGETRTSDTIMKTGEEGNDFEYGFSFFAYTFRRRREYKCLFWNAFIIHTAFFFLRFLFPIKKKHESSRDTWKIIFVTKCSILLIFVDFGAFVFSYFAQGLPFACEFSTIYYIIVVVLAVEVECLILNKR